MNRKLLVLTLCVLPACDLIPDSDIKLGEEASENGCVEKATVLAGVDVQSALGFAAADVLAVAEGSHEGPMAWGAGLLEGPVQVQFGPESGQGALTVGVKYEGGEVRFITSTPKDSEGFEGPYAECGDRLEVDVAVTVDSGGGAFAESFTAPLRATSRGIGRISRSLGLADVAGSFAVTKLEPQNAEVGPIELTIGISESGIFGSASTMVEMSDGEVVSAGFIDVARWPAGDSSCESYEAPLGLDAAVAGFSAEDALALVAAAAELSLTWQGGQPTAMSLDLSPGTVACAIDSGDMAGTLRIPATAAVQTEDGRWNGSFAVEVVAQPAGDGSLAAVRVAIPTPFVATVPAAEFLAAFGLSGVDLTGYDEGSLDFTGDFQPGGGATGQVTVLGVKNPMCSNEPGAPCEGNDYTEIEMATWSTL